MVAQDDRGDGLGRECSDYGEHRFTLARSAAGLQLLDMTGPQRASTGV